MDSQRKAPVRHLSSLLLPGSVVLAMGATVLVVGGIATANDDLVAANGEPVSAMVSLSSQDTFVNKLRPRRAYGAASRLRMTRSSRQALVAVPTPPLPDDLSGIDAELCLTPLRSAATRVAVFTSSSEWSGRTSWRTRPAAERTLIARTGRVAGGAQTCVPVPTWALEEGDTEFRLRATSRGKTVVLASSEAGSTRAPKLKVKLRPTTSPTPTPTTTPTVSPPPTSPPTPNGPGGTWNLKFQDDFTGSSVDSTKWADWSWSQGDGARGNKGNQQLEWNQAKNCSVDNGLLTITAKPDNIRSASGVQYDWSSCLLTTIPSYSFRYGYMETRAKFPSQKGFWPAFWTWQIPGYNTWTETDAYEYYSDNSSRLYLSQHSGDGGGCTLTDLGFNPSGGFHTYGVDIKPAGTDFYVDGSKVCTAAGTSTGLTNIIINMAVYSHIPPAPGTVGIKQVDYVRAWQR